MALLVVGISDLKVATVPDLLITHALGSCVGICLHDPVTKVAGMSHIMLPNSALSPGDRNIYKFADTAIPEMVIQMGQKGGHRSRLRAKIAGGAQMFEIKGANSQNPMWQIGQRNVTAVTDVLRKMAIPIIAQDVLKNYGRTVTFDPASGMLTVKAINQPPKDI